MKAADIHSPRIKKTMKQKQYKQKAARTDFKKTKINSAEVDKDHNDGEGPCNRSEWGINCVIPAILEPADKHTKY